MQHAALSWHVQTLKGPESAYWLGVTAASASLPIIVFAPLGGAMADHFPKRRVLLATQSAAMIAAFAFAALVAMDRAGIGAVLVFAVFNGVILACDIPARQAFAVEMVGKEDLMSAIALNSAVFNVGRLVGPMVFGLTMMLGIALCFFLNGLSFLGVLYALARMSVPGRVVEEEHADRRLWSGFRAILADRRLTGLVATLAVVLLTGGTYFTLLPALAANSLKSGDAGYSALLTANGLGALVGSLTVAGLPSLSARRPTILLGILLMTAGLVGLGVAGTLPGAIASVFVVGMGFILFLASTNSTVQLSVADGVRGRVMSVWVLMFGACQPVGNYMAGWIAAALGTQRTFLIVGVACLLAAVLALAVFAVPERHGPAPLRVSSPRRID